MARFKTVIKTARFVYSPSTATEMQGFAQALADSIRARIQSGQNIYGQAAGPSNTLIRNVRPRGLGTARPVTTGISRGSDLCPATIQNRRTHVEIPQTIPGTHIP
jgi:hypothetical protein